MKILAYLYSDPLLDSPPDPAVWGWEVDRVYQDVGVSLGAGGRASRRDERPQLQQLLWDCQSEPGAYLLVRRLDELGESVETVGDRLQQLSQLGVQVVALDDNPEAHTLQQWQALQGLQRSRQIRRGHARNRVKALPPPGKAPFGYRRGKDRYVIDRVAAPLVKEFFDHFLLYGSLRGAVRHLEKKYGKKISASTGQRWLTHPVYRGNLAYANGDIVPETHAPILAREEAAQVDRLLRRNRRLAPRTASAPRSLAGLVRCQTCESAMTVTRVTTHRRPGEYLYLRPQACPRRPKCCALPYSEVLDQTIQTICQTLPPATAQANLPGLDAAKANLEGAIARQQAILQQLPDLLAQGILDSPTAELRAYTLRTEIADLQAQLAQLPPVNLRAIAQAVSIPQFWLDLSEAERRFFFREFLRHIDIVRPDSAPWRIELQFIF